MCFFGLCKESQNVKKNKPIYPVPESPVKLAAANGSRMEILGFIRFDLQLGDVTRTVDALVISALGPDCILLDMLYQSVCARSFCHRLVKHRCKCKQKQNRWSILMLYLNLLLFPPKKLSRSFDSESLDNTFREVFKNIAVARTSTTWSAEKWYGVVTACEPIGR